MLQIEEMSMVNGTRGVGPTPFFKCPRYNFGRIYEYNLHSSVNDEVKKIF